MSQAYLRITIKILIVNHDESDRLFYADEFLEEGYDVMTAEDGSQLLLDDVVVGRHCRIKKAIVDKNNVIPPHTEIGYHPDQDRERFTVTPRGIVVVPKGCF